MNTITISIIRPKTSILDKSLSKGKNEVSLTCFALLFSEIVQYCQSRSQSIPELQNKLTDFGKDVGSKLIDIVCLREKNYKRDIKLVDILIFIKSNFWKNLFGKEADKLEHANDDEHMYYLKEKDSLVNRFISVPKDKAVLNCAVFVAGIIEAVLNSCGFASKVTAHWYNGTTYMIKFDDSVIARNKQLDER